MPICSCTRCLFKKYKFKEMSMQGNFIIQLSQLTTCKNNLKHKSRLNKKYSLNMSIGIGIGIGVGVGVGL